MRTNAIVQSAVESTEPQQETGSTTWRTLLPLEAFLRNAFEHMLTAGKDGWDGGRSREGKAGDSQTDFESIASVCTGHS